MQIKIEPERIIPARYTVNFYESKEYSQYLVEPEPYDVRLRDDLADWLDTNAPNWKVWFDRGYWGEGPAHVVIDFDTEAQAVAFKQRFNLLDCPNALSKTHCPNMSAAVGNIDRDGDGKGKCLTCGYEFVILTRTNRDKFFEDRDED